MKGEWDLLNNSIKQVFGTEHSFINTKTQGVGQTTILKFLGKSWKAWEIQEALSQLDDKFITLSPR
jgi:hypothetical protein